MKRLTYLALFVSLTCLLGGCVNKEKEIVKNNYVIQDEYGKKLNIRVEKHDGYNLIIAEGDLRVDSAAMKFFEYSVEGIERWRQRELIESNNIVPPEKIKI